MQQIIPTLYCPFPSAISSHADVVDRATVGWAERFELVTSPAEAQRLQAIGVGWLAARTNPTAPLDGLQLLADWCTWLFLLDDLCDEGKLGKDPSALRAVHANSLAILRGVEPDVHAAPASHALRDLRERMRQRGSAGWMKRFIRFVATTFDASVWEATNRAGSTVPDVRTYIDQRSSTGALYTALALAEIMEPIDLPDHVRSHPVLQGMEVHAINTVCWANDIISLAKEIKQGDVHNLVLTLRHKHRLSLKESIVRATALHDAQVRAFLDLELRLPSFGPSIDTNLQRYVAVLRSWMRGNFDWAITSGRYLPAVMEITDTIAA